jgi:hypothetical protein
VSDDRPAARPAPSRPLWILICVILAPAVILPLWVGLYDKTDPELGGWPFYYWFQMALILISAVLTIVAFVIAKAADRKDREARRQRTDVTR